MSEAQWKVCPEYRVMLHGFVDGELDPAHASQFQDHITACPGCRAQMEEVRAARKIMNQEGVKWRAPVALRSEILSMLAFEERVAATLPPQRPQPQKHAWRRALDFLKLWSFVPSVAALAASLFLFVTTPSQTFVLQDEILGSHIRSMMANHLTDVLTSDQHTVKPWFNGKIDFSPPVADLVKDGFPLVGGRVDYLGGRAVAALVYRRNGHVINLFIWPGNSQEQTAAVHEGYNMEQWSDSGLDFWAISDVAPGELVRFREVFRGATKG
ncbi:anti-sigma factor [Rhizobium sp. Root1220]|uniref:anti-sigma factor family protein n=1 Tax=Rhizobium sp. Root1220 TaxID=1736432 RepID=UPI0006F3987D|nr:anti-sigma factor [Rhizobium sp. Root1220]KQV83366.1 anti-sigma factor [Rhizobium sp. Root1220]